MKIALVNPRIETYSSTLPPLGLLYIAAVLEKGGFEVRVFDLHPNNEDGINEVISYNPDVVGISILTTYIYRAKHVISLLREKLKDSIFIIGGIHPTALPEESLSYFEVDYVVIGEGEITMKELLDCLKRNKPPYDVRGILFKSEGKIIKTPTREMIEDLDSVPFPARHLVDFEKYLFPPGIIRGNWSERSTTVITSRGCPNCCIFCGSQAIFGHRVRRRSVENVIQELNELVSDYGIDTIWFIDDTFTIDKKWVQNFCGEIHKNNLKLRWGCQARVNTIDEDTLYMLKKAGLIQIDIGVESGSDKVLRALKKGTNKELIRNAFRIARKVGVRTMASFVFGSPEEEREDVEETFMLAKEIKPDFTSSFFLTPFPGTELMKMAKENNWITEENYLEGGLKKKPIMKINFSEEELYEFRKRFQKQFLLRNYLSLFRNPLYVLRVAILILKYPAGLYHGFKAFLKTRVFDDFIFAFLIYYAGKKQSKSI